MPVQGRLNINTTGFVIYEYPASREDDAVILQDAGRVAVLAQFTLMGKIAATGKWAPFDDPTVVTGVAEHFGIYMGDDIAAADLVAGDVIDVPIVYGGMKFDEDKLVFDDGVDTLDTVIGAASIAARTVRDALAKQTLIPQKTDSSSAFENA